MTRARKIALGILAVLAVVVVAVAVGIGLLFYSFKHREPAIPDNSVLALKIEGDLPDYVPDDITRRLLGQDDQSLTSLLAQIKKAKVDKRISGILLEIDPAGAGWGKTDEIREAIADFRTSGKPIYAYMEYGANKEYYLATACDKIFVAPPGDLYINGLAADVMFFRGSLDKLGIYPDVMQIGKYKNAPDQFTRKEMSESHREVMNSILDDLFNRIVEATAKARKKTPDEVRAIIDNAPLHAGDAASAGMIDGAMYRDDVEKELKKRLGYKDSDDLHIVRGSDYKRVSQESLGLNKGERIAVIYASGGIGSGRSSNSPTGEQTVGSDTVSKAISDAAEEKNIKAIVLRVNSPGGSSYASDIIWHAVDVAKQLKPVVVSMGDMAASGGYYIACDANKIVAEPSTITGSIGIFAGKPVLKDFYNWLGISNEYVMRGKLAGIFRETEKFSPEERAKFEAQIKNTYYNDFVPKVAKGRGKDPEYIDSIGQGRVWMGSQAKTNGLVDEFGGLDKAVEIAKQLANIPADKSVQRVILPYPRSIFDNLFGTSSDRDTESDTKAAQQRAAIAAALPENMRRALQYAELMDRMERGEVMAIAPFELRIK
jgi:protease-4